MLSSGAPSARTEALLDLQATACSKGGRAPCNIPGSGALRVGKWKLMHGHSGVWDSPMNATTGTCAPSGKCSGCVARAGTAGAGHPGSPTHPIPISANESWPWCPFGWTPPPRADGKMELPRPAPDLKCTSLPCAMPKDAGYITGHTMLFDVVADMYEEHDVAAENPDIVTKLLARLQQFNTSHCSGQRCLPDDAGGPKGVPVNDSKMPCLRLPWIPQCLPFWLPWRGDPTPAACDTNRMPVHVL